MPTKLSTGKVRRVYQFIKANAQKHDVRTLCRLLQVAPSGKYVWLQAPISDRAPPTVARLRERGTITICLSAGRPQIVARRISKMLRRRSKV
jgi:hypothetical protein